MSILFEQYLALKKGRPQEATAPGTATHPIPFETLEALDREALGRLSVRGMEDLTWLDSIDFNSPSYNEAKDRLNEVWLKCLVGKATLEEFKESLAHYEQVVLNSVRPRVEVQGGHFEAGL